MSKFAAVCLTVLAGGLSRCSCCKLSNADQRFGVPGEFCTSANYEMLV